MYIRRVWHPPQTNCAISVPAENSHFRPTTSTDTAPELQRFKLQRANKLVPFDLPELS